MLTAKPIHNPVTEVLEADWYPWTSISATYKVAQWISSYLQKLWWTSKPWPRQDYFFLLWIIQFHCVAEKPQQNKTKTFFFLPTKNILNHTDIVYTNTDTWHLEWPTSLISHQDLNVMVPLKSCNKRNSSGTFLLKSQASRISNEALHLPYGDPALLTSVM